MEVIPLFTVNPRLFYSLISIFGIEVGGEERRGR